MKLKTKSLVLLIIILIALFSCDSNLDTTDTPGSTESLTSILNLQDIELSEVILNESFSSDRFNYTGTVGISCQTLTLTPTIDSTASVTVNGTTVDSGSPTDITLNLGDNTITIVVTAEDGTEKTYTFTITRGFTAQQAYLKASNTEANDCFGDSVAISGDTIVVGANSESSDGAGSDQSDNSAPNSGAVYVFTRSGTSWTQQAYLKASNTEAVDYFGFSVAISGDTIVVGANEEDSNATGVDGDPDNNSDTDSGAAYVFTRSGTTWTQQAYLKASNTDANDKFGYLVAISGDTIVVGASGEQSTATGVNGVQTNNDGTRCGAAYIFTRSGTSWTQQAYLKASNTEDNDYFGSSAAISGDTVVVGAGSEDSNATGVDGDQSDNSASKSGAAYVFTRSGIIWTQQAYIKASKPDGEDHFGDSVAISGDTIVVGAYGEDSITTGVDGDQTDNSASNSGAAYVFTRSETSWTQQAYLKASNAEEDDYFGSSVAISGDNIVVGAYGEFSNATGLDGAQDDNSAEYSGAAYVFTRSGTSWTQQAYLKASNAEEDDYFGSSVAISGDSIVVGASSESSSATGIDGNQADNSASESGAAYVYY